MRFPTIQFQWLCFFLAEEVCFEKPDFDSCTSVDSPVAVEKWFFNSSSNECQTVKYDSDCQLTIRGSRSRNHHIANVFDTKSECLTVCPALTHCERTREKNMELRKRYQHFNYMPSCDAQSGDWNPTQCFDEVGMCWCVNKKGEPIKGTMTNGTPKCQSRRGRLLGASSSVEPLVCDKGVTVHKCNVSLCEGKMCLGHPSAKCYINPCGGCQEKWMTEDGEAVNCDEGLTKCQQEMQRVVNSQAQRNTLISIDGAGDGSGEEIIISESKGPMSNLENSLTEIFLSGSSRPQLKYHEDEDGSLSPISDGRAQVTPIFGNFGDHKIIGLTASMVTFTSGGPSLLTTSPRSAPTSSEEKDLNVLLGSTRKHASSRATSIADILADMMRAPPESSTEQAGHESGSLTSPEFIDLMPSSSQLMYGSPEHVLPAPMGFTMGYGGYQPQMIPLSRGRRAAPTAGSMEEASSAQDSSVSQEESFSVEETSSNPEILVSIIPRRRPGACPPPSHVAILNLISGACRDECDRDHECDSGMKCCISHCGLKCMEVELIEEPAMTEAEPFMGLGLRHAMPSAAASDSFPSCKYSKLSTNSFKPFIILEFLQDTMYIFERRSSRG